MDPVYIIAEMAYSHDGSAALATSIAESAARAGADALSIHITHMPDYMVRHYRTEPGRVSGGKETKPIYDYLCEISLPFEAWRKVVDAARRTDLDIIVMPNDGPSLDFAETLSPDAYVLSPACFEEYDFIGKVAGFGRPVYLRVGGATLGEIEEVIRLIRAAGNERITLLYGHQNYPTAIEDANLTVLARLKDVFGLPVGIADHVDADDDFAGIAPLLAIPLGISCIEKHITHDRAKRGEDFEAALNGDEFASLVGRVRKAERALGEVSLVNLAEASAAYRRNVRKRLVAARNIAAGETIAADAIAAKRSDEGLAPSRKDLIVGRVALRAVARGEGLTLDLLGPAGK